ncbi:hypothetical protein R1flu_010469 [Riccia fluitans]|uniref:Uncharacterized protein n=1 Tax=Riccia fluitans TaxID=41844 RepID=A0ABD1Z528_9MARC
MQWQDVPLPPKSPKKWKTGAKQPNRASIFLVPLQVEEMDSQGVALNQDDRLDLGMLFIDEDIDCGEPDLCKGIAEKEDPRVPATIHLGECTLWISTFGRTAKKFREMIRVVEKGLGRPPHCCLRLLVAWPRRDTTTPGSESTKGCPSFLTMGHTGPADYVDKNAPDGFRDPAHQPVGLLNIPPAHSFAPTSLPPR